MGISPTQLLIILVIVALVFGTKKLRNMGGDLGGAVKGFKNAMHDDEKKNVVTHAPAIKASTDAVDAKAQETV